MGQITFIRHGQASHGAADYDKLSPLGHQQSDWLGQYLRASEQRFDRVVCGTLRRHRETLAGIQSSLNHPTVSEDARLNEMSFFPMAIAYEQVFGALPAAPEAAEENFVRVMQAWVKGDIPDAPESYGEFSARILAAVNEIAASDDHVLVVSSGGVKGVAVRQALGLDLLGMTQIILRTYNASISRFSQTPRGFQLMQFNLVPHLESPTRRHALTYL